jgi:cob(I)alamin adenosyltransferase
VEALTGQEWGIGELARAAGVSVRALRHWESVGLLEPSERSDGGHRRYDRGAVQRLMQIVALREIGFGLETIGHLLSEGNRDALVAATARRLEQLDAQIEAAEELRHRLRRFRRSLAEADPEASLAELIDRKEGDEVTVELSKIYTRLGDGGETHLGDMTRVPKTDPRIDAGGGLDELSAQIGSLLATDLLTRSQRGWLARVANDLKDIGAELSVPGTARRDPSRPQIGGSYVSWLEEACDEANADLEPLDSFVLWFDSQAGSQIDVCRAVCRRAERDVLRVEDVNPEVVRYLNRLSDLLFVLARQVTTAPEALWEPGRGAQVASRHRDS